MKKITASMRRKKWAAYKRRYNRQLASSRDDDNRVYDRISRLPDEVLVSIISRLTIKEATATSLLSPCWRHLHTRLDRLKFKFPPPARPLASDNIDGEDPDIDDEEDHYQEKIQKEFSDHVQEVNRAIDSCGARGEILKEFGVDMHSLRGAHLEKWLRFALSSREIETVEIRMRKVDGDMLPFVYALNLTDLIIANIDSLPGLQCLKELSLCGVEVDDVEVEILLSNLPNLESLSIWKSNGLRNIYVDGGGAHQPLKLKHLDISDAENLETAEIRDLANLVSLKWYVGKNQTTLLWLTNVPKLTEFDTSGLGTKTLPTMASDVAGQLRMLKLSDYITSSYKGLLPSRELGNLVKLELKLCSRPTYSADQLLSLVDAFTSLEALRVEFLWEPEKDNIRITDLPPRRDYCSTTLKKLVVSEYKGNTQEFEFAYYVVNNYKGLKQLVIEPCNATPKLREMAACNARGQLGPITSKRRVKLVIDRGITR